MEVLFLGTGTSQGIPVIGCDCLVCSSKDDKDIRLRTSVIISKDDCKILIDTSPDLRQQFLKQNIDNIDAILYTHEHNDHVNGIDDIRPINFKFRKDIPIYGSENLISQLKHRFSYIFDQNPYPGAPRVIPNIIKAFDKFNIEDIKIEPIQVQHGQLPILGYLFNNLAYITDANFISKAVVDKLMGIEVLIINALQHKKHHSHFTLDEAIAFSKLVKAKRSYLIHMSHRLGRHVDISKDLPENIFLAFDGMKIRT